MKTTITWYDPITKLKHSKEFVDDTMRMEMFVHKLRREKKQVREIKEEKDIGETGNQDEQSMDNIGTEV